MNCLDSCLKKIIILGGELPAPSVGSAPTASGDPAFTVQHMSQDKLGSAQDGILIVATPASDLRALAEEDIPFAVYIDTDRYKEDLLLEGAKYILEGRGDFDADDFDDEVFENIYRRIRKIPWVMLETDRCILRETWIPDLDEFYEIYSDTSVTKFTEDLMERSEEEKYTENYRDLIYEIYGHGIWTIVLKETGEIIGRAGLDERAGYDTPELGFVIGVKWQRQGFAEEVCRGILNWASENDITEVMSITEPENIPCVRLLTKLGFKEDSAFDDKSKIWKKKL